uniref:Putative muscle system process n=1 Tax=Xenopsylla cheopis TaxID=163159 RepID=A0A6M2DRE0_XENCH
MSESSDNSTVELYVYDLTKGVATILSPTILGHKIDGVWHTAIVVYGREYFFGVGGIQTCVPGSTVLGNPQQVVPIGSTKVPYSVFLDYVLQLGDTTFKSSDYDLFKHNCNIFSDNLAQFLCGANVPKYILDLPKEVLSTTVGSTLRPILETLARGPNIETIENNRLTIEEREHSPDFIELNTEIEEARLRSFAIERRRRIIRDKLAKNDRKKEKRKQKYQNLYQERETQVNGMSETEVNGAVGENGSEMRSGDGEQLPSERVLEDEANERRQEEERKRLRDPPIVFRDIDVPREFDALVGALADHLSAEEQQSIEELHQYMIENEGSWALSDGFLTFVGRVLNDPAVAPAVRVNMLRLLAAAALKDDVILLLHQDRRDHVMMNFAQEVDRHTPDEQNSLALFLCNMFENLSSSEWLLYISEWDYKGQPISNIRGTTKVAVHCLLAAQPELQDLGTAIIHNMACKEVKTVVFDDVAVELTMAILQFFNSKPIEEYLFRCMKALAKFCQISGQEVPQLIQMIGPSPANFKGQSERVDELILQISKKLR